MLKSILSIIIPTFNSAKFLSRALDSIVSQQLGNVEVWIIDGRSTDGTLDIIKIYSENFSYINSISEKDDGVYDAMNRGAKLAKGKWLYFMGSDDYFYDNQVLVKIGKLLLNDKYDMIYGNVLKEDINQIYDGKFNYPKLLSKNICHQAIFLKKTVFDKYGPFDTKFISLSDHDLNLKLFKNKIAIKYVNLTIAIFSKGGISGEYYDSHFHDRFQQEYVDFYKAFHNKVKRKLHFLYRKYVVKDRKYIR